MTAPVRKLCDVPGCVNTLALDAHPVCYACWFLASGATRHRMREATDARDAPAEYRSALDALVMEARRQRNLNG